MLNIFIKTTDNSSTIEMIIFRQFLTKQNKSILSAQYLVLGVQIACGVWWAGGVFWQKKKHVLSSRGHPNKDGKNSECSEHIRAIFLPPHANISRFYNYFSVFTTNGAPAVLKKC